MPSENPSREERLAEQLQRLLRAIEVSGFAVMTHSTDALLKSIVEAAARLFGAAASSIALVDEREQTLKFVVAYGAGNEEVVGMSIPIDQGIAGYVAMTGQPIAVSNVQQDTRFNQSFAKTTGYVPRSILATPLLSADRVIGVMEVLDKIDAASFGIQDLELLGMFANQAAIAIQQSRQVENIGEALILGLRRLVLADSTARSGEIVSVLEEVQDGEAAPQEVLAIADLFNEISGLGEAERKACLEILTTFADYSRSQRRIHR